MEWPEFMLMLWSLFDFSRRNFIWEVCCFCRPWIYPLENSFNGFSTGNSRGFSSVLEHFSTVAAMIECDLRTTVLLFCMWVLTSLS